MRGLSCGARVLTISLSAMSSEQMSSGQFSIGLLGHGTVGAAFAQLLEQRAPHVQRLTGRQPLLAGTLTRSSGSFEEIT